MASKPILKDLVGRQLAVDDIIVTTYYNSLVVGKVVKLNSKTLKYKTLYCADFHLVGREPNEYPQNTVIIENTPHITTLMLKGSPQ